MGNAPALLSDFNAKVADASSKAGAASSSVLPLTPAGYNAGTAKPVLIAAQDGLVQGKGDLIAARSDAAQIVTILKGLEGAAAHLHHGVLISRPRPIRPGSERASDNRSGTSTRPAASPAGLVPRPWAVGQDPLV